MIVSLGGPTVQIHLGMGLPCKYIDGDVQDGDLTRDVDEGAIREDGDGSSSTLDGRPQGLDGCTWEEGERRCLAVNQVHCLIQAGAVVSGDLLLLLGEIHS